MIGLVGLDSRSWRRPAARVILTGSVGRWRLPVSRGDRDALGWHGPGGRGDRREETGIQERPVRRAATGEAALQSG